MTRNRRTAAMAGVLALAAAMGVAGVPTLRGWVAPLFPGDRYPLLLALFFLSWLAADRAPTRARPWVLLGGAGIQGLAFDPILFAVMTTWVGAFHAVVVARVRGELKVGFVIATLLAWAVLCDAHHFPGLASHPVLVRGGYLFATGFFLQALRVLVDLRDASWPRVPRVELLVYFLVAPCWIVVPYMLAILPLEVVRRGVASRDPAVVDAGVRTLAAACAGMLALHVVTTWVIDPRADFVERLRAGDLLGALPLGILFYPVLQVAKAFCAAGFLLGLLRVLGIAAPPFQRRPLLAQDVGDWWRRWNLGFRDLLVDIFWTPVVLRLRRRPATAIVVGCAAVFLAGSPLLHWPKRYFAAGSPASLPVGLLAESLVMTVLVVGVLLREHRARQRGADRPSPSGRAGRWRRRLTTWALVFLAVCAAGQGADHARSARPVERAQPALAEGARLLEEGRVREAALRVAAHVADLERAVRTAPRSPQRRADLAFVRAIASDPRAVGDLANARRLARGVDIAPPAAAVEIDADRAMARAARALQLTTLSPSPGARP